MAAKSLVGAFVGLLVGIGLATVAYRFGKEHGAAPPGALQADVTAQKASLDGIEQRIKRLEETTPFANLPADAESSKEKTAGDADRLAALESSLASLLLRVKGLEQDPIRRGESFIDAEDAELRREGINLLARVARFDPAVRAQIRDLLQDPSSRVREQAVQILRDLKDKESAPQVKNLLADPDAATRRRAIQALTAMEARDASREIGRLLTTDTDNRVRVAAADALGRLKSQESEAVLTEALKDRSDVVKGEAIASLGEIGAVAAAPNLRAIYDQDPGNHRVQLAIALKSLGDEGPLRAEVGRLSEILKSETNQTVRQEAQRALNVLNRSAAR